MAGLIHIHKKISGDAIVSERTLRTWAEGLLAAVFGKRAASLWELSIALLGDREMRDLNRRYRGKDRATDVLSFAMQEGGVSGGKIGLLGDIAISIPTARRQALLHRHSARQELLTLLIHGFCHLLGYDHQSDAEEREMRREEKRFTRLLLQKKR